MIIDCFPFRDELELLEIRLGELKDTVDWFVMVEASETYSGRPKPFVYEAHQDRFDAFNICYIKINGFPPSLTSPWHREEHTRNALMEGLKQLDASPNNIVLLSDIDEIPRAESVRQFAPLVADGGTGCCVFTQSMYYFFLNFLADRAWHGTRMVRYQDMPAFHQLRTMVGKVLPDAGWHFRYQGGVGRIQEQIGAAVHREQDRPPFNQAGYIADCIRGGRGVFDEETSLQQVAMDQTFPSYLQANSDRFRSLFHPGEEPLITEASPFPGSTDMVGQGATAAWRSIAPAIPLPDRNEALKQELWSRWGHPAHPAEWDGRHLWGGKGSQRFWEYLWAIQQLPDCKRVLDIGAGSALFLPDLLATRIPEVWAIDPEIPSERCNQHYRAQTLEDFLLEKGDEGTIFDAILCVSVLEHVADKPRFCRLLDVLAAPIILTFELSYEADLVTMPMVYDCLGQFQNHYLSKMETCPVWADNSAPNKWRPCGVVLLPNR